MNKLVLKIFFVLALSFLCCEAKAQEFRDPAASQAYYYDDFEYTGGSLLNWTFNNSGTAPRSYDLKNGSLLNGTYCLGSTNSTTNPATYYIGNKLINSTTNLQTTNTSGKPVIWEWSILYRNNTGGSATNMTAATLASVNTAGNTTLNAWKFWLSSSTADPTSTSNEGYYITQNGTNIALIGKSNAEGYRTIITSNTTIAAATNYNIKIQRTVDGAQVRWRMYITAGSTDGSTIDANGTNAADFNTPITTYNRSFLESVTRSFATNTFRWDDIKMYSRALAVAGNNGSASGVATSSALYQGQTNVALFGFALENRGITNVTDLTIQLSNSGNSRFTNTKLVRSVDASFSTTSDNSNVTTGFAIDGTVNLTGLNVLLGTAGDKNDALPVAYYYFLVADVAVNSNPPPTIRFSFPGSVGSTDFNYGVLNNTSVVTGNFTYTFGLLIDWKGTNTVDWNTPGNWSPNSVPTANDVVRIGVVAFTRQPNLSGTAGLAASLQFGAVLSSTNSYMLAATGANYFNPQLTLSTNLTVGGDISSPAFTGSTDQVIEILMTNTSTISAASLTVGTAGATSSLTNNAGLYIKLGTGSINLTGDITLNGSPNTGTNTYGPAAVFVETGTVSCNRVITNNTNASSKGAFFLDLSQIFNISGASTLKLNGAAPFVLSPTGTNLFVLGSASATANTTVNYASTSAQIVSLNLPGLSGATTAMEYDNVILSGNSTKTVNIGSGTLKINGNLSTSGTGTIADFTVNNPVINVAGSFTHTTGNTVKQGTGAITVAGGLNSAGTFTGGVGALSVAGETTLTGGTFTGGSGDIDFNGATLTNNGSISLAGGTTTIAAATFTNGTTGSFTSGTGIVNFDLGGAQAINNNSTTPVTFNNVNFTASNTKTLGGTGTFAVNSAGTLTMAGTATLAAAGKLTLNSDATSTATVALIPVGATITGNVTAQRFMAGGNGKRGYRLLSSPVSNAVTAAPYTAGIRGYNLSNLQTNTIITGPVGNGGFTASPNNNPSVFVYRESETNPATRNINVSDYKGFASITEYLPVGNGVLFFFRGNQSTTKTGNSGNAFTSPYPNPENTTLTSTGTVNIGPVSVNVPVFNTTASYYNVQATATGLGAGRSVASFTTGLSYTDHTVSAPASTSSDGFNLVGNPFPATIDLESVTWGAGIGTKVYVLNSATQGYGTYVRSGTASDGTALNGGSRYVLSGQGFFVKTLIGGTSSNRTVTFPEAAKSRYPSGTFSNGSPKTPIVFASRGLIVNSLVNPVSSLHIKIVEDSILYNETLLTFSDKYKNEYNDVEDAAYLTGPLQTLFLYSNTTDGSNCVINNMSRLENIIKPIKLYADGAATGIYQMQFKPNAIDPYYRIFLKDAFTKDSLEITANQTYTFNINRANAATYGANRFSLVVHHSIAGAYQLVKFTGDKTVNSAVKLTWEAKNESTVITFNVERSTDGGKTFTDLGMLQSSGKGTYNFTDVSPATNLENIYRLKQADVNDAISYSDLVNIAPDKVIGVKANTIVVYPNPATEKITIDIFEKIVVPVELQIVNSNGKVVKKVSFAPTQHIEQTVSDLMTGAYIIDLIETGTKRKLATSKFIKI